MTSILPPFSFRFPGVILMAWLILNGCGTLIKKSHQKDMERLQRIIKIYNNEFESKSNRAGAMWVRDDLKAEYLTRIKEVFDRVTFMNSQILSITFKSQGKPIAQNGSVPEEDFDEALVAIRYEYVLSPSISLKTKVIQQRWTKQDGSWKLVPDLKEFLQ